MKKMFFILMCFLLLSGCVDRESKNLSMDIEDLDTIVNNICNSNMVPTALDFIINRNSKNYEYFEYEFKKNFDNFIKIGKMVELKSSKYSVFYYVENYPNNPEIEYVKNVCAEKLAEHADNYFNDFNNDKVDIKDYTIELSDGVYKKNNIIYVSEVEKNVILEIKKLQKEYFKYQIYIKDKQDHNHEIYFKDKESAMAAKESLVKILYSNNI